MYGRFLLDMISGINCVKNSLISDLKLLCWHRMSNSIACPQLLLQIEPEFLGMHVQLFHLCLSKVIWLAQFGVLSKFFPQIKDTPPLSESCLLGQAHLTLGDVKVPRSVNYWYLRTGPCQSQVIAWMLTNLFQHNLTKYCERKEPSCKKEYYGELCFKSITKHHG